MSDTATYTVTSDSALVGQSTLYEAVMDIEKDDTQQASNSSTIPAAVSKVLIKIYACDELAKFNNEVEKLNLLNQIMEEIGEKDFIVQVIESFEYQIQGSNSSVLCIVMEHLEMSLSEYMTSLSDSPRETQTP